MTKKIKTTLGKGLDSMLGGETLSAWEAPQQSSASASIAMIPLDKIKPNPNQPRRAFSDEGLQELAESLRHLGLVQPITVQRLSHDQYQIISGERRFRAAELAELTELPAYIREVSSGEVLEMALVENIQREDLTAIEIALAYQNLLTETGATQEQVAQRVGKNRATVANYMRLLRLPAEIQLGLSQRLLEMGHARALLQVDDPERQLELYHMTLKEDLSVREVEELAKAIQTGGDQIIDTDGAKEKKKASNNASAFRELEDHLGKVFGSKVRFRCNPKGKGSISIPFTSEEDLERLIALLQRIQ